MIALLAAVALASPCGETFASSGDGMAEGPVTAGLLDGDLGRARRVCGRDEVGLTAGGLLTVDTPAFYGHLVGGATFDGSWAIDARTELFGSVEVVRYDSVISALSSTYIGAGHTAVGATRVVAAAERSALATTGRVVLPTAFGLYRHSWPFGLDLGLAGLVATSDRTAVHAQVSALGSAALSKGPTQGRVGLAATAGGELRVGRAFGIAADLVTGFGSTAPVDVVAGALELRFGAGARWGLALGVTAPFAGRERALATADLRTTLRF